jgi:hypothetical protein
MDIVTDHAETWSLVGAESPLAGAVELHEIVLDGGVMRMRVLERLALTADQGVALRPGSYHLMLHRLRQPLAAGSRVPLVLRFQRANGQSVQVEVQAVVRDLAASPARATPIVSVARPCGTCGTFHAPSLRENAPVQSPHRRWRWIPAFAGMAKSQNIIGRINRLFYLLMGSGKQ